MVRTCEYKLLSLLQAEEADKMAVIRRDCAVSTQAHLALKLFEHVILPLPRKKSRV